MNETIGKRITKLRKEKNLKQENLAQILNISPQAVSKWENDITCPDISVLPELAKILGVTVDELLTGKKEEQKVKLVDQNVSENLMLKIEVLDADGDKVKINLPIKLVEAAIEMGVSMSDVSGINELNKVDIKKLLELAHKGVIGNLIEIESSEGAKVNIFIE